MARLGNIQQYEQRKAAAPPVGITTQSQSVREGFQQMGEMNPQKPVLQTKSPSELNQMYENTRKQALGHESNQGNPQKAMEYWNASPYEYWTEQVKANPNSTYAIVNQMFASNETPEQKRKRERREQLGEVFNNLGNLIGNAANLYYTHRGGQYIDLNSVNEKHRARMQQIKDKQDALDEQRKKIILNAKLGDINADRAEKLADKKTAAASLEKKNERTFKIKYDAYMKELDHAHKMGQIDAQTKARLAEQAAKFKSDKELEAFKQQNRLTLKATPSYGQDKVLTSLTGADGNVYTRNSKLDNVEMRELAKYIEDWSPYTTVDEDGKETIDYIGAIADAAESGLIPTEVLEQRGYKKGKSSGKKGNSLGLGIGSNNKNGNKLGIGL